MNKHPILFVILCICTVATAFSTWYCIDRKKPLGAAIMGFWTGFNLRNILILIQS